MTEEDYQMGIRELSPCQLITIISQYRRALQGASQLLKDFAEENFGANPLHKIPCAMMHTNLEIMTKDYREVLDYAERHEI